MSFPPWSTVHTIVFDFDGIFTDNLVLTDQLGNESVLCSRSDGLGFDIFRNFCRKSSWTPDYFILSKESNPVVSKRAHKLKVKCIQSAHNKLEYISHYLRTNSKQAKGLIYLGNDLNDLSVMAMPDVFSVAPCDSHPLVISRASCVLPRRGGHGFVRLFIELLLDIESMPLDDVISLL